MLSVIGLVVALVVGFVTGLLVGRRNPAIADTAANLGNEAKTGATAVKAAVDPAKPPA